MKKYLYLLMLVLFADETSICQTSESSLPYCSIPASPYPITIRQSDGSLLMILGKGSQWKSWTETIDGYSVVKRNGIYEYAKKENGQLVPSGVVARDLGKRTSNDENLLQTLPKSLEPDILTAGNLKEAPRFEGLPMEARSFPALGKRKSLLLLIRYPDLPNTFGAADFGNLMNQRDYRGTGSFRDYFLKSSFGQLDVETDVMGWVTARQPYQYYGYQNGYGRSQELVREAVDAAQAAGVDFSQYDNDKDGIVDGINVVHSGPGAEEGSQTQYIWSHRWGLGPRQVVYDGVRINDYIMNPEVRLRGGNSITGIGVFCHEFGHLLGLPDLYDTTYESEGVGNWSLMGGAGWLGGENSPGNLCAWSKFTLGWINPTTISSSGTYTLNPASENAECFRINTGLSNEYFLIENRQRVGLDSELPGTGLAVWHINSSQTSNTNFNRKMVDLEEADGLNELDTRGFGRGDEGDLFPGSSVNSSFDDFTKPDSKTYTLANNGISVKDISIDGAGVGSFSFAGYNGDFSVTSFSPTKAGVGSIVNITGVNLTLTNAVDFGGVPAASFSVVSPSSIMALVGEGASGAVTVGNGNLNRGISGFSFFYKPEVASFSPEASLAGGSVKLVGKNLLGATEVSFGGTAAVSFEVLSDTTIIAVVGDGASGDVAVNTPGGNASLPGFSFLLPSSPTISSFTPTTVCSGAPATITVNGTNFTGATAVIIDGIAVSSFRVESSSVILATWNSPQQGPIAVTTPAGIAISESPLMVNPLPKAVISADGPTSFFTGGSVRLSAESDSGYLYSWYRDGQVISGESDSDYVAALSGSYTVSITSKNCSAISPAVVVTVSPVALVPTISAFTPAVACSNDPVALKISGTNFTGTTAVRIGSFDAISFEVESPLAISAIMSPRQSGTVSVSTPAGTAISDSIFTVNPVPAAVITAGGPTTFMSGGSVLLSADADSTYAYAWYWDGQLISGQVNSSYTATSGGSYTVGITSKGCRAISSALVVSVNTVPTISSFTPESGCSSTPLTLTIIGANFSGATAVSIDGLAVTSFQVESSTTITALVSAPRSGKISVTTPAGTAISSGSLTVNPLPSAVISAGGPTILVSGGSVLLSAEANPGYTYTWYRNGEAISGQSNSTYLVSASGSYTVSVISKGCQALSSAIVVTVNPLPPAPTISSFTPASVCGNAPVTITINGSNFNGASSVSIGGFAADSFRVESPSSISAVVDSPRPGSITVITPDGTATSAGSFTVNPMPAAVITAGGPTTFLSGGSVLLSAIADSTYSYAWYRDGQPLGGQASSTYTATSGGSYTAGITSKGCLAISSAVVVTVNPVDTVPMISSFTPEAGCSSTPLTLRIVGANFTGATAVSIDGLAVTSFRVESSSTITALINAPPSGKISVTTPAGTAISSGSLTVNPLPSAVISAGGPTIFLSGGSVLLSSEVNPGYIYTWYRNGEEISGQSNSTYRVSTSGSYTVSIISNGCQAFSSALVVTVNPLAPVPTISSFTPASVCGNAPVTITINGTNFNGASAVTIGGVAASSFRVESNSTISAVVSFPRSGLITVITPDGTATSAGSFTMNPLPSPVIRADGPTTFLSGGSVLLSADADSTYSYTWYRDGQVLSGQVSSTFRASLGGSYTISVTSKGCRVVSSALVVTMNPLLPAPAISSFTPESVCGNTPVTLVIYGTNFTGASSVSIGGIAVSSFKVESHSTISAILNAPVTGMLSVTTAAGSAISASSFTVNPVPRAVIRAGGPTTFFTGGSVLLSADPDPAYTYAWYRNGEVISGQSSPGYTATIGGSYSVAVTSGGCLTQSPAVLVSAIFGLPVNNFNISAISESCKTSDNGQIHISAVEPLRYTALITGNGKTDSYPFEKKLEISSLTAGSYKICITVEGQPDYEKCYDLAISEPKDLAVYAFVNNDQNTITLNLDGAKLYMIDINGTSYQTSNSTLTLPLTQGVNKIRISTGTECQGTFEKIVNVSRETIIFPNPFTNVLNVNMGNSPGSKVLTEIYSIEGRLVQKQDHVFSETLQLELSALKAGYYTLKLTIDHSETYYKIIKL